MKKPSPIPFRCADCGAEYEIFIAETPTTESGRAACAACNSRFPRVEGEVFLNYHLVKKHAH